MLLLSPKTVRQRIQQHGLERQSCYSNLTLDELDVLAEHFVQNNPFCGEGSFEGFLRARGLKVQRSYVRESMVRVDSRGVQDDEKSSFIVEHILSVCQTASGIEIQIKIIN